MALWFQRESSVWNNMFNKSVTQKKIESESTHRINFMGPMKKLQMFLQLWLQSQ